MPPSRIVSPGSSTMARVRRSTSSSYVEISPAEFWSIFALTGASAAVMDGSICSDSFSAIRSRAFAVPTSMRVKRRSKSRISANDERRASRSAKSSTSSCTASSRMSMATMESSGDSSHFLSRRLPMAVFVKSSTSKSVSFLPPSRRLRVISRLRSVYVSTARFSLASRRVRCESCVRSVLTVSCR